MGHCANGGRSPGSAFGVSGTGNPATRPHSLLVLGDQIKLSQERSSSIRRPRVACPNKIQIRLRTTISTNRISGYEGIERDAQGPVLPHRALEWPEMELLEFRIVRTYPEPVDNDMFRPRSQGLLHPSLPFTGTALLS